MPKAMFFTMALWAEKGKVVFSMGGVWVFKIALGDNVGYVQPLLVFRTLMPDSFVPLFLSYPALLTGVVILTSHRVFQTLRTARALRQFLGILPVVPTQGYLAFDFLHVLQQNISEQLSKCRFLVLRAVLRSFVQIIIKADGHLFFGHRLSPRCNDNVYTMKV
jgi:hypothetical protein